MQIKLFLLFCEKKINKIWIPRVTSRALGSLVCLETSIEVHSLFFPYFSFHFREISQEISRSCRFQFRFYPFSFIVFQKLVICPLSQKAEPRNADLELRCETKFALRVFPCLFVCLFVHLFVCLCCLCLCLFVCLFIFFSKLLLVNFFKQINGLLGRSFWVTNQ